MFVPNFEAIVHVTLVLGPKNAPKVWRKKPSQSETAEVRQEIYFTRLYVLRYPFIPTNPHLIPMSFFLFFERLQIGRQFFFSYQRIFTTQIF